MDKYFYIDKMYKMIVQHKDSYDKRYIDADGNTYYNPDKCPMTRGEFYSLMEKICTEVFEEDEFIS